MAAFDHIVVAGETLESASQWVGDQLGAVLSPGGRHGFMGTHNQLLSLGPQEYLEIIAIDPDAPAPPYPRWFGLDSFHGPPRLVAWVIREDNLTAPSGSTVMAAARGDLRWRITIPDSGISAQGGTAPLLIDWQGSPHPAGNLPDYGLRLDMLDLTRPGTIPLPLSDPRIRQQSGAPRIGATIQTPNGPVRL